MSSSNAHLTKAIMLYPLRTDSPVIPQKRVTHNDHFASTYVTMGLFTTTHCVFTYLSNSVTAAKNVLSILENTVNIQREPYVTIFD